MRADLGPVLGVLGGSGGVGASCFAAVLAMTARAAVLVDLDVAGGGIDVLLGIEAAPGARWSGLQVAGGRLEPSALLDGLPRAGPCAVLAADCLALDPAAVRQVLGVATELGPVVVDLPRNACAERSAALLRCDLVVVRRAGVGAVRAAETVGARLLGVLPPCPSGGFDIDRLPRRSVRVAAGVLAGLSAARRCELVA